MILEHNVTEEQIRARIEEYKAQQEQLVTQANQQMQITYGQALEANEAITRLLPREMRPRLALRLRAIQRELQAVLADFDAERQKRLAEFSVVGEDGRIVPGENGEAIWREPVAESQRAWGVVWQEISQAEVTILNRVPVTMLDALADVPGNVIAALAPVVDEGEAA